MSYEWPVDVEDLFEERYAQMLNLGLPQGDVDALRVRVNRMWSTEPGAWSREWSDLAGTYVERGEHALAALAYGYAKFPALANDAKRAAYRHQIDQYLLSVADEKSGVTVERRVVQVEHAGQLVPVPVHQFTPNATPTDRAPVVIASGGVDTWKEDFHKLWGAIALFTNMTVLAFDIAGTGESTVPMTPVGGTQIVEGLAAEARAIGDGRVAYVGISMGGYFSARAALSGLVDATVVCGGPVRAAFDQPLDAFPNMVGIIGNALGLDAPPTSDELAARWEKFSLATLLETSTATTPTFVFNGADDPLVPQEDSLLFEGRPNTTVVLFPDSGHCAPNKLDEAVPQVIGFLTSNLPQQAHA